MNCSLARSVEMILRKERHITGSKWLKGNNADFRKTIIQWYPDSPTG
jgi:hypothetical protein